MRESITCMVTCIMLLFAAPCSAAMINAGHAAAHAGESAMVCGTVASVYYARRSRARPTFLDFGAVYPRETFTAVIFGDDRRSFGDLGVFPGMKVCVTGPIDLYRGHPEIILRHPSQLQSAK